MFPDVESMFEKLKPLVHDRDFVVRQSAITVVGFQQDAPDLAIPLLCEVVRKGDSQDVMAAASQIVRFGTNALQAVSTLSNVVERLPPSVATRFALGVFGDRAGSSAAVSVADVQVAGCARSRLAVQLLILYPTKTEAMFSTLEGAARDLSPPVARQAQLFFKDHYKRVYPNGPPFEAEPTYDGKPLDYWLKQRNNEDDISVEAQTAIRAMGSNAVPALLSRFFYMYPHGVPAYDVNLEGASGFAVLGEAGIAALPKLQPVLEGTNETMALYALAAVSQMGSAAMNASFEG